MGSELKSYDTIYGQPIEVLGHLPGWLMVAVLSVMTASVTEVRKYLIIVTGGVDDLKILGASTNLVGLIYPCGEIGLTDLPNNGVGLRLIRVVEFSKRGYKIRNIFA